MAQVMTEPRLREWMARLGPRLIRLSAAICHDRHQAEDVVQEAFVKLWRRPPEAGEPAFGSWLRRVVVNLSINTLQRTRRPAALPDDPAPRRPRQRPDDRLEDEERFGRVMAALERLDESKRAILVLRAWEQMSYEEISEALDVPIGTVMSRLNRARLALMEEVRRGGGADDEPLVFDFQKYRTA